MNDLFSFMNSHLHHFFYLAGPENLNRMNLWNSSTSEYKTSKCREGEGERRMFKSFHL